MRITHVPLAKATQLFSPPTMMLRQVSIRGLLKRFVSQPRVYSTQLLSETDIRRNQTQFTKMKSRCQRHDINCYLLLSKNAAHSCWASLLFMAFSGVFNPATFDVCISHFFQGCFRATCATTCPSVKNQLR